MVESTSISRRPFIPALEIFESNGNKVTKMISNDCVIVGRSKQADISLDDDKLSRNHFMIVRNDGRFEIKDLNSSNGIVVNGKKVKSIILTGSDTIVAGETSFHFSITRDDLRSVSHVLVGEPSFKGGEMFEKKYSKGSKASLRRKALLSALTASILIFAVTLAILSSEKEAKVIPSVKKESIFKQLVNIDQEIANSGLSEEDKVKAKNIYMVAQEHFKAKNYPLAKKTMEEYYSMIPSSVIAPPFIAACDEAANQKVNVADRLDDIERDTAKRELIADLLKRANAELNNNNYEEAISIFLKIINIDEYNEQAYDGLVLAEKAISEKEAEKLTAEENTKVDAGTIKFRSEAATFAAQMERAFKRKDYTKAFELALRITKMGQERAGRAPFLKAVRINRSIIAITNNLYGHMVYEAGLLARADAVDEAMKVYQKVLAMFPYHAGAKLGIGKILRNKHEQAKYLYASALVENSYPSDNEAKTKLKMILNIVPRNDVYYQKALRALKRFS